MLQAWTSSPAVVEIVLDFFKLMDKLLEDSGANSHGTIAKEARNQLPPLAAAVFRSFQERLDWLERFEKIKFRNLHAADSDDF